MRKKDNEKMGDMNVYTNHQNLSAMERRALNKLHKNLQIRGQRLSFYLGKTIS